jgi:Arc/MetJ-type ribon-helix-helix transcriptional regulator
MEQNELYINVEHKELGTVPDSRRCQYCDKQLSSLKARIKHEQMCASSTKKKMQNTSINLTVKQREALDALVHLGFFPSRSEAIRRAVDDLIDKMMTYDLVLKALKKIEIDGRTLYLTEGNIDIRSVAFK